MPSSKPDQTLKAIGIVCVGFFLVTTMGMLSKLLSGLHNPIEISFYRNISALLVCSIYIVSKKRYDLIRTKRPLVLSLRGIIGIVGLISVLSAVQNLPMSTATTLFFASTLMLPVFATFILKEKVGPHRWSAVLVGMIGVVIITQPSPQVTITGIVWGLLGALSIASAHTILRFLKDENSFTVTLSYFLFGTIFTAPFMPFVAHIPTMHTALILLGIAITGGLFQYILTVALKMAPASVINPFNYTGLLWAALFDIIIWHVMPGNNVWIGAGFIITANLYILYREHVKATQSN